MGLSVFDGKDWSPFNASQGLLKSNNLNFLKNSHKNQSLLLGDPGFPRSLRVKQAGKWSEYNTNSLSNNSFLTAEQKGDQIIAFNNINGVFDINPLGYINYYSPQGILDGGYQKIFFDKNNNLWV